MSSENYRYYSLDGTGRLNGAEWISAASDEDAIAKVKAKHPSSQCELWQGRRLVAQLGFTPKDDIIWRSYKSIADSRRVLAETATMVSRNRSPDSSGDAR